MNDDRHSTRDRVLDAADALLREGGPDALSMRALAERADVGHVTPYRLFDSKYGVVFAQLVRAMAPHVALLMGVASGADPLQEFIARQHRLMDVLAVDEAYFRAVLLALDDSASPTERGRWLEFVSARSDDDLRRLAESGVVRNDAPLLLTGRALLVGRDGALRRWFRGLSSLDELRSDYLSVTLHVLLAVTTDEGRPHLWAALTTSGR